MLMKRALMLLAVLALLAAALPLATAETQFCFTDATGYDVALTEPPQKVAVLFSSFADIWVTAGGTVDITVGESVERGFADETALIVDAGSGHSNIDLEALVAAKPDLVIGTADYDAQVEACEFLRSADIPAALFRVESLEDYLSVLKIFTDLTGKPENYARYGTAVADETARLLAAADAAGDPTVKNYLFVRAGSSSSSTKAKTAAENFACAMIDRLGAHNIADDAPVLLDGLSLEAVVRDDPDWIFITTMGDATEAESYIHSVFTEAGWRELTAVKAGQVTILDKELFHFKPNARWAEAERSLIEILYPEMELE